MCTCHLFISIHSRHISQSITGKPCTMIPSLQSQSSFGGRTPKFFEECDKYWTPSSIANELYEQLSARKYREILRPHLQWEFIYSVLCSAAWHICSSHHSLWHLCTLCLKCWVDDVHKHSMMCMQCIQICTQWVDPEGDLRVPLSGWTLHSK